MAPSSGKNECPQWTASCLISLRDKCVCKVHMRVGDVKRVLKITKIVNFINNDCNSSFWCCPWVAFCSHVCLPPKLQTNSSLRPEVLPSFHCLFDNPVL